MHDEYPVLLLLLCVYLVRISISYFGCHFAISIDCCYYLVHLWYCNGFHCQGQSGSAHIRPLAIVAVCVEAFIIFIFSLASVAFSKCANQWQLYLCDSLELQIWKPTLNDTVRRADSFYFFRYYSLDPSFSLLHFIDSVKWANERKENRYACNVVLQCWLWSLFGQLARALWIESLGYSSLWLNGNVAHLKWPFVPCAIERHLLMLALNPFDAVASLRRAVHWLYSISSVSSWWLFWQHEAEKNKIKA